jgi:hypothetical protein
VSSFEVTPDDIRGHGTTVVDYESQVAEAASAAETTLDTQAFGLMLGFLPPVAVGVAQLAKSSISDQATDLGETATSLRQMADNSETTDANARNLIGGQTR